MSQGHNKYKYYNKTGKSNAAHSKQCANPIFEQWLLEWREDAIQKNSKMQIVYSKALGSLRKYPLPLKSGKECKLLEFFGDKLCRLIDLRISKEPHLFNNDETLVPSSSLTPIAEIIDLTDSDSPPPPASKSKANGGTKRKKNGASTAALGHNSQSMDSLSGLDDDAASSAAAGLSKGKKKKTNGGKSYVPVYRSGAYALLVTLFMKERSPNYRGYMLKSELQHEAQQHCDTSLTKPDNPNSHYTAWNAMSSLVKKSLVLRQGTPVKFMLTIEGRELAAKCLNANLGSASLGLDDDDDVLSDSDSQDSQSEAFPPHSRVILKPGEFEVVLCVDNCETNAKGRKEEVIGELVKNGVNHDIMKLNIGDFVWVCRATSDPSASAATNRNRLSRSNDLILPFVVERKRADDLAHSIRDRRFREQKHRLGLSGLKPIYLLESYGRGDWGLADGTLTQAIVNTQIVNDFLIQETGSLKETCTYLTHMTRHLSSMYQNKLLTSCSREEWPTKKLSLNETYLIKFIDFNEFGMKIKNWSVSEMFARHILRLRGMSTERAEAVINKYPTLQALLRTYRECATEKERELLLANIYFGDSTRTVGPAISRAIYKLYTASTLL